LKGHKTMADLPELPKLETMKAKFQPPRIVLNAVEGFGKTSFAAYAPNPAILMSAGETGYETLLGAKRVPAVPAVRVSTWNELIAHLTGISVAEDVPYKNICLDAIGGFEKLLHDEVCRRDFGGKYGDDGFMAYHKGYAQALPDWQKMLGLLDKIRDRHAAGIILISHAHVRPFKNPVGADFDQYASNLHPKTWAITAKWSDAVLFGNFLTITDDINDDRAKGVGGTERVIYTERRDAWEAKNRYGLPAEIKVGDEKQVWKQVIDAMTGKATA